MIWQDFEANLFSTIANFTARTVLIIGLPSEHGRTGVPFVQFAGINALYGGNTNLIAEICGENVPKDMAIFTPQQRDELKQLGFTPFEEEIPWQKELPWPTTSHIIWNTVRASTLRLRDIGGIESPDLLVYKAWRYPNNSDTEPDRDIGDKNLHIPELGIPREREK